MCDAVSNCIVGTFKVAVHGCCMYMVAACQLAQLFMADLDMENTISLSDLAKASPSYEHGVAVNVSQSPFHPTLVCKAFRSSSRQQQHSPRAWASKTQLPAATDSEAQKPGQGLGAALMQRCGSDCTALSQCVQLTF